MTPDLAPRKARFAAGPGRLAIALLVLYLIATLAWIDRYPRIWVDEGWIAEPAWSLVHGGPLASPSHGPLFRFDSALYWMPPMQFLALAGGYALGAPALLGGRLLSVAFGGLGLLALLAWTRAVDSSQPRAREGGEGPRIARAEVLALVWLAAAWTLDPVLWKTHRTIRFESLLTLCSLVALAAAWRRDLRGRSWIAGLAAGLALLTHPNGLLVVAAAAGVLWFRPVPGRRRVLDPLRTLVAAGLVFLPFGLYLLGDRESGFANVMGQNAPHFLGHGDSVFDRLGAEWRRYRAYFAFPALAVPLLGWLATAALAFRARAPLALSWVLGVYATGLALFPNKSELYLTLLAPVVYVTAATAACRVVPARLAAGAGALWLLFLAGADAALLVRHRDCDPAGREAGVAALVPPSASVAGSFTTWFALTNRRYYEFHRQRAGDLADARPDYVVWDDGHLAEPIFERLRAELRPALSAHADSLGAFPSSCSGEVSVWRVRWDEIPVATTAGWERYERDTLGGWRPAGSPAGRSGASPPEDVGMLPTPALPGTGPGTR